jgi:hypothetical protein
VEVGLGQDVRPNGLKTWARKNGPKSRENEYGLKKRFSNLIHTFEFKFQRFKYFQCNTLIFIKK